MIIEEFKQLCRDEILGISSMSTSEIDRANLLSSMAQKICECYDFSEFKLDIVTRGNVQYIIYKFNGFNNASCSGGFVYNYDTFDSDIASAVTDIIDGNDAINILNEIIESDRDKLGGKVAVYFVWGRGPYCKVYDWDYSKIGIKISRDALANLLDNYREGAKSFRNEISSAVAKSAIGKAINAKIEDIELINHLTRQMLNRNEAISYCKDHRSSGVISLQVVEIVQQLGVFVALANWVVDFKNKNISVSLINEQVIDVDNAEVISNYGICSRIEQIIGLSSDEINSIMG